MLIPIIILSLTFLFCLWAYFAMFKVKPRVERPKIDKEEAEIILDLETRLKNHVVSLAGEIGERNVFCPVKLNQAALYIRNFWENIGYPVTSQPFWVKGIKCENLSIEIFGRETPDEILVIGAHYDSVLGSPGANDNGSAVAALLEISRLLNQNPQNKTNRFQRSLM